VLTLAGADGPARTTPPAAAGDYPAFYAGIRDAILGGVDPPVRGEDAVEVVSLLELAIRSAAEGRVIRP
jgi:predicted dehydrogenase